MIIVIQFCIIHFSYMLHVVVRLLLLCRHIKLNKYMDVFVLLSDLNAPCILYRCACVFSLISICFRIRSNVQTTSDRNMTRFSELHLQPYKVKCCTLPVICKDVCLYSFKCICCHIRSNVTQCLC